MTNFKRVWTAPLAYSRRSSETVTTNCLHVWCSCRIHGQCECGVLRTCAKGYCPKVTVGITDQHFTHNQNIAHTSTAVFSTSVVVSSILVLYCLCSFLVFWTQCCTDRTLSVTQAKGHFHKGGDYVHNEQQCYDRTPFKDHTPSS